MSGRLSHLTVYPANGGLVETFSAGTLNPRQWQTLTNWYIGDQGVPRTRHGLSAATTALSSETFTAISDFHRLTVSGGVIVDTQKYVAIAGTHIYKCDVDDTWDSIKSSWGTNSNYGSITLADGFATFWNGKDTPQKWDQTTISDINASCPVGAGAAYHLRRLFVIGIASGDGSTVQYCAASDITDWTGSDTGNFALDENDGDYVIGVSAPWNGRLYFFKGPNVGSVHELSGTTPSTFSTRRVFTGAPSQGHRSIVTTPQDIYWLAPDGVYSLQNVLAGGMGRISDPVRYSVGSLGTENVPLANETTAFGAYSVVDRGVIFSNGASETLLCYSPEYKLWSKFETALSGDAKISTISGVISDGVGSHMNWWGSTNGVAYARAASAADGGNNYTLTAVSPVFYSFPGLLPSQEKAFHSLTVFTGISSAAWSPTYTVTYENGSDTGTLNVASDGSNAFGQVPLTQRARSAYLTLSSTANNVSLMLEGYDIAVAPGEDSPVDVVSP